jgi:hypothetical protein|tara:strand:- start:469 stop:618 length:150 start_codon:yes stop_codon:yes gene_type:complete
MLEIVLYSLFTWCFYKLSMELERDIFKGNKRRWSFISEVDGKEYFIEEE